MPIYLPLALAVLFAAAVAGWLVIRRRRGEPVREVGALRPQTALGRSALIEYAPVHNYEAATARIVSAFLDLGRKVVLVTQAPRARMYLSGFKGHVEKGQLKVINLTAENPLARPRMFMVATGAVAEKGGGLEEELLSVSINNLEYLTEITQEMEERSVLIFEALTGLILALGSERREAVYKFFSSIVEDMSAGERTLIAFLNREAHEREVVSAYEGLFINLLKIEGESFIKVKGERERIPFDRHRG